VAKQKQADNPATPAMAPVMVPVGELTPNPVNYRSHPQAQIATLEYSLRSLGQYKPIVCSRDGVVLAGHGVLQAAKAAGEAEVAVVYMPFAADDPRAAKLLVADNESQRGSEDDGQALAALLADIQTTVGLDGTGHDAASLDALIASMAAEGAEWPQLADGDRQPFQQMTFTLSDEQAETVRAAMAAARDAGPFVDTGNENGNGNALARVCEAYGG
jgi:hypothetical protein